MPPEATRPFVAAVLAAQGAGEVDPLAAEAGLTHKCLVPIAGQPLIAHPVAALLATPGPARIRIVIEPERMEAVRAALPGAEAAEFVPAADNLADSVLAACEGVDGPVIVTTADNVLLTPGAVRRMLGAMDDGADAVVAMATRAAVQAAHPDGQRRFYRFRDDHYSNCNLYGLAGPRALAAVETFRGGGQFARKPLRLVAAAGLINVALMMPGFLTLAEALTRLGRRFGLRAVPAVLTDGAHAIDADNRRTFDVAATLLERRGAGTGPAA